MDEASKPLYESAAVQPASSTCDYDQESLSPPQYVATEKKQSTLEKYIVPLVFLLFVVAMHCHLASASEPCP